MHAFDKCSKLWKKAGKPKSSEIILEVLNHTLSYPGQTRWNSYFDSISQILKEKHKLPTLFQRLDLVGFKETEVQYLEEYVMVMSPLAATLDFLQGQNMNYYGYLLPSIISLKNKLEKLTVENFSYGGQVLLEAILKGINKRFLSILTLHERDAVFAAVLCPQFKLRWFQCISSSNCTIENIKHDIVKTGSRELSCRDDFDEKSSPPLAPLEVDDNFFDFNDNNENEETVSTKVKNNHKLELELIKYLDDKRKNFEMLNDYPLLKKLSLKFNTCLPSSAAVERMFSFASIVNSPRRNALSDDNFEMLVLLKANYTYQ
ncbi:uncharacterized protein LOC116182404 [Photinus pyralis]|uniref:uncharacterized protein LOC116182404 n=1 Tax=Photinus pyralis TaxID=7054 RepID=UPI00126749FE|nr:uncharacterized protein LOC116182404 [Photinus pyralis]